MCNKRLLENNMSLGLPKDIARKWASQMYARIDGGGLMESNKIPQQHLWIQEATLPYRARFSAVL